MLLRELIEQEKSFERTQTMYGLLVEAIIETIKEKYGSNVWDQIKKKCRLDNNTITAHQQYSEALIQKIVKHLSEIVGSRIFFTFRGFFLFLKMNIIFVFSFLLLALRRGCKYPDGYVWRRVC